MLVCVCEIKSDRLMQLEVRKRQEREREREKIKPECVNLFIMTSGIKMCLGVRGIELNMGVKQNVCALIIQTIFRSGKISSRFIFVYCKLLL